MSLRKTIPLYYITFLVLWLGGSVKVTESFEVTRGYHDKFLNSQCSTPDSATSDDGSACSDHSIYCTNSKKGKCDNSSDCTYCICNVNGRNTFIGNGRGSGECVKDEDVEPESVPEDSFSMRNNNRGRCARQENDSSVRGKDCKDLSHGMLWIRTTWNQFMNIGTLQCIEVPVWGQNKVAVGPCNLDYQNQEFSCSKNSKNIYLTKRLNNIIRYLRMKGSVEKFVIEVQKKFKQVWANDDGSSTLLCDIPTKYKGCYRFSDGSFLRFLNVSACQDDEDCLTQEISAPIFKHNINCEIKWEESEYIQNDDSWKPVSGRKQFLSLVLVKGNKRRIQLDETKISNDDVLEEWNGSLLKLQIKCSNKLVNDDNRPSEQHCILLKFVTLPHPQDESTNLVPPETTQKPSIFPITINPTSSRLEIRGSSSSKAVAISVSIVALVLILLLVFGFIVFYRRRKRMQEQRANSEEMTSRGEQNPQKVIFEELSQIYEPLKDDRGEASGENFYEGLIATTLTGDTPQEMTSRREQNPQKVIYDEPSQIYEPLKDERGEASGEHYYKGLIATTPLGVGEPPQSTTNDAQLYEPLKDERGETSGEHYYEGLKATNPPAGDPPQDTTNDVYEYIDVDQLEIRQTSKRL